MSRGSIAEIVMLMEKAALMCNGVDFGSSI